MKNKECRWINTIQAHDCTSLATAKHRAGLKALADEFGALVEERDALRARLSRKAKAGRKPAKKCACGAMIDSPRQRKRNPAHECWINQAAVDAVRGR